MQSADMAMGWCNRLHLDPEGLFCCSCTSLFTVCHQLVVCTTQTSKLNHVQNYPSHSYKRFSVIEPKQADMANFHWTKKHFKDAVGESVQGAGRLKNWPWRCCSRCCRKIRWRYDLDVDRGPLACGGGHLWRHGSLDVTASDLQDTIPPCDRQTHSEYIMNVKWVWNRRACDARCDVLFVPVERPANSVKEDWRLHKV